MKKIVFFIFMIFCVLSLDAQAPANDNCTSAQTISIPSSGSICVTSTTVNALSDNTTNDCDTGKPGNEVWFTFIATGSQNTVTVTPNGSPAIQQVVVSIDGTGCGDVGCNTCGASATNIGAATATWSFTPGAQVWISVESNNGTQGGFELCITSTTPPPSPGNSCTTATILCNTATFTINPFPNNGSSITPSCFGNATQQPAYFEFTVGQTGNLLWQADVLGVAEYDWAIFNITSGCPGNQVACNYNYTGGFFTPGNSDVIGMVTGPGKCNGEFCDPIQVNAGNTYLPI